MLCNAHHLFAHCSVINGVTNFVTSGITVFMFSQVA